MDQACPLAVLKNVYDFFTCTEVVEHCYHPAREWPFLLSFLKPSGWLGIMTKLIDDPTQFPGGQCISDVTHASFFSRQTFDFLADRDPLLLEYFVENVILLQKPESA